LGITSSYKMSGVTMQPQCWSYLGHFRKQISKLNKFMIKWNVYSKIYPNKRT